MVDEGVTEEVAPAIRFLEATKFSFAEIEGNFCENHLKYFPKRCSLCLSYPHATRSDLHLCLICSKQMCSITCAEENLFAEEAKLKDHFGNLNKHAEEAH